MSLSPNPLATALPETSRREIVSSSALSLVEVSSKAGVLVHREGHCSGTISYVLSIEYPFTMKQMPTNLHLTLNVPVSHGYLRCQVASFVLARVSLISLCVKSDHTEKSDSSTWYPSSRSQCILHCFISWFTGVQQRSANTGFQYVVVGDFTQDVLFSCCVRRAFRLLCTFKTCLCML